MPSREETITSCKTLIDLHFRNIEKSQRRLFELRTSLGASAGDDIAFNKSLIEDEIWEIHKLEVLIKRLEQSQRNDAQLLRRMVRLGGSFWLNRKTQ
ncbi:hypothetical protein [Phyllobacterium zundukense]|uniref:Uncharacterized protein n=1 Tax=Phyllobacterium zundukense TaxID=1867719 RepID=A0A2N9VQQ6_9HYPH|nr:hypothetical protein [Phyllobacterium zundukense]ATU91471.1 hypothetical protein BLM14_07380 [Phyllobacterium zundukense]PIO41824.1 hypothetical protein B5P45_26530 [Phyllobacterium zundukense]